MRSKLKKSGLLLLVAVAGACGGTSETEASHKEVGERARSVDSTTVITLIFDSDPNRNAVRYSPDNRVSPGEMVVIKVQGTTQLYSVSFPDASCFSTSSFLVGGSTIAQQTSDPQTVLPVASGTYRFLAEPSNTGVRALDTPGTVAGDLEVVPESGG
ncbi:hypothetical protein F0U61_06345 [Archangium violaceum]|uniref:hypothetical protein n=1 Tax=Archangium violaceum TaxID=83451 RepID=UPI002B2C4F0D|nr:hypothetical protein F0U61_06345 [Archangium violaceum]